jgi:hypothetical protein
VLIACGLLGMAASAEASVPSWYANDVATLASVERQALNNFMGLAPNDPRTYSNGVWTNPGTNCWWCLDTAATAAGVLARQTAYPDPTLLAVATQTFNDAIVHHQNADGSWDESPVNTGFFAVELGTSYFELQDVLDPATRSAWATAMRRAANYIINAHALTWYINGNVNLRQAGVMWMTWKITGDSQYYTDFKDEWNFTLSPPQTRWPGFGLHATVWPTKADGSDGAGYLAESGGGVPGFDPEYTMTQLDTATNMYVVSHDSWWLWLMNMFFNQLRPRINSSFILDATGGTRRSLMIPFFSGGLAVLYGSGDRPDLASLIPGDLSMLESQYTNTANYTNANFYRGLSGWLSMIVLNLQRPLGLLGAGATATAAAVPPQPAAPTPLPTPGPTHATSSTATPEPTVIRTRSLTLTLTPNTIGRRALGARGVQVTIRGVPAGMTVAVMLISSPKQRTRSDRPAVLTKAAAVAGLNHRVRLRVRVSRGLTLGRNVRLTVWVALMRGGRVEAVLTRNLWLR